MPASLAEQIAERLGQIEGLYHRLILVVAPPGSGKTSALRHVQERMGVPLVNVNLELSRHLLDLTKRQRILQLPRLLGGIVTASESEIVLLDNIEILFEVSLKQDPLRLLQGLSRNKTIVAAWNGSVDKDHVTYARSSHPEYRRYPAHDFLVASLEVTG